MTTKLPALSPEDTPPPRKIGEGEKQMQVYSTLIQELDFIRIKQGGLIYVRPKSGGVYRLLSQQDLLSLARDTYLSAYGVGDVDKIKKTAEAIKLFVNKEIDEVSNNIIEVAPKIYWDGDLGELVPGTPAEKPCFHKLFNTKYPSKHIPRVDMTDTRDLIWGYYNDTLSFLETHHPDDLPEDFSFISTWADHSHEVYMDLMRAISYCFLKEKPVGSYILIGEKRNGKSSFIGLLHTIFGEQNTSMVRLSQIDDAHYSHQLLNTMLNAPDEEDDKVISAQADFKTLADHGTISIPVMRSNEPVTLHADFMCFYPMNHMPEWKGSGSGACLKRSLVIPFYADLSQYDTTNDNFAEDTFTPPTLAKLIGQCLALANYYTNHDLDFSVTMQKEQRMLEEEQDSAFEYREDFLHFFDGFTTKRFLYDDYVRWCKTYDKKITTRREFDFLWRQIYAQRSTYTIGNTQYQVRRLAKGLKPLIPEMKFPELTVHTPLEMHELGISVVEQLTSYEKEALGK